MEINWQELFYALGTMLIIGLAVFWSVLIYIIWKLIKRINYLIENATGLVTKYVPIGGACIGGLWFIKVSY